LIYVSKNQLKQVEYLIGQSIHGNHVLFDLEAVRRVFWKSKAELMPSISEADAYEVEHHIEKIILEPTLAQKRAYLEGLDEETYSRVVKTYFNIVENNLYEKSEIQH
jgi:hypothetical protein